MKILKLDSKIQVGNKVFFPIRIGQTGRIYAFNRVKFVPPAPGEYHEVIVYDKDDEIFQQLDACFVGEKLETYPLYPDPNNYYDFSFSRASGIQKSRNAKLSNVSTISEMLKEAYGLVDYKPGILLGELLQKEADAVRRRSSDSDS